MKQDFFKFLPSEIINDILLRLPVRTIAISKCVCKPWLDLLKTDEFLKSHLSRSRQCLAVLMMKKMKKDNSSLVETDEFLKSHLSRSSESCLAVSMMKKNKSSRCIVYELEEEIDAESSHERHYGQFTTSDFPEAIAVFGSANGLLLILFDDLYRYDEAALYVCNPISREYIKLNCPPGFFEPECMDYWGYLLANYGFGVSKVSGQYKVVRIIQFDNHCHVYTLGTGSPWRRVEAAHHDLTLFEYDYRDIGAFINGNLHWLVRDLDDNTSLIICFDLETECFSTFSLPPIVTSSEWEDRVFALRDCLCWCDQTLLRDGGTVDIWSMKEYGVEKSWTKEYVINFHPDFDRTQLYRGRPIKVFKDGDILIQWYHDLLYYYSNKMKTTQQYGIPDDKYTHVSSVLFTPSFLSLRSFKVENVFS